MPHHHWCPQARKKFMPGLREYPPPTSLAVSDGSATSSTLQAPAAPSASSVRLSPVDMWTTRAPPTNPRDQEMSKNLIAHSTQTRSVTTSDRQPGNRDTRRRIRYLFWPPFTNPPGPSPSLPISNGRSAGSTIWGPTTHHWVAALGGASASIAVVAGGGGNSWGEYADASTAENLSVPRPL